MLQFVPNITACHKKYSIFQTPCKERFNRYLNSIDVRQSFMSLIEMTTTSNLKVSASLNSPVFLTLWMWIIRVLIDPVRHIDWVTLMVRSVGWPTTRLLYNICVFVLFFLHDSLPRLCLQINNNIIAKITKYRQ